MVISGILGVWLHILIDGAYHFDVKILWPNISISLWKMIHRHLGQGKIQTICLIFFPAALVAYIFAVRSFSKNSRFQNGPGGK